ncbi:MAG: hypothetical protein ACTSSE_17465 [Candidatus Thorarchaeota archaeon]
MAQLRAKWSVFQDYGIVGYQQSFRMLIVLNVACVGLQIATVAARVYGAIM